MAAMTAPYPGQISAVQVGTTFAGQYYHLLQQQPALVHHFYNDASTVMRIDGSTGETAMGVVQIHSLLMSLNFSGIEVKMANSLDSYGGGVLVMVSGSAQTKEYGASRKFVQTFFLAPQEKGYFVLSDIFQFVDEEHILQHSMTMAKNHFVRNLEASNPVVEPVSEYMLRGEVQSRDFESSVNAEVNEFSIPEPQKQVMERTDRVEEAPAEEPAVSSSTVMNTVRDPSPAPAEEPVGGPPKQTYASILRVSKGHPARPVPQPASGNKNAFVASEWHHASQTGSQQHVMPMGPEKSSMETVESGVGLEDEGDTKSLYVGNLPSSVSASELERELKNFGRIKHNGVIVRNRKDSAGYYAFVEFEDVVDAQSAVKASPIAINGHKIYLEERKSNNNTSRAGRRGRGRSGYQSEGPRGRGRGFARGPGCENDRELTNRWRGNGFNPQFSNQDRGILGNHHGRNWQGPSEVPS